jgi:IS5 family transposase
VRADSPGVPKSRRRSSAERAKAHAAGVLSAAVVYLSDPGVEEALYDSLSMRRFAGIDLGESPVPDESTVCRFRHLLEAHALGEKLFQAVHDFLERQGITVGTGTIVDATIISAPASTKNQDKAAIRTCTKRRKAISGTSA